MTTFSKIKDFTHYSRRLRWYQSSLTGLQMVIISVPGPICHLDVVVRTEVEPDAYDNPHYGMPHTLEHLIFMGSDDYQYKGILDQLANRCFSQGTNAYTAVDQTVYTVSCGGSEGFFRLLPVYLDHIFNPTITDAAFTTEVHHINEEGEDAGVVYCEMQGCENTAGNIAYHSHIERLYKGSSYASNTGGHVEQLRRLTADKVREFHKKYYRPDNCCVILTGDLQEEEVFETMKKVEDNLCRHSKTLESLPSFERPFFKKIPYLTESSTKCVEFPANDEDGGGYVYLGWRLGDWDDLFTRTAMYTLWNYLCESSISPIKKEFVETENPLAGSASGHVFPYKTTSHSLFFSNVNPENCDKIVPKFFDLIKKILEDGIDMERMARVLKKRRISELSYMEESPHSYFTDCVQDYFLYSQDLTSFEADIDEIQRFIELEKKDKSFWEELMRKTILDTPVCVTISKPSIAKGEQIAKMEEERLVKQKVELGEETIKKFGEELQKAEDLNSIPVPKGIIRDQFPIPKVEKIPKLPVATVEVVKNKVTVISGSSVEAHRIENSLKQIIDGENNLPVMIQLNHYESEFVNVRCFMDTSELQKSLRPYIELYLEAIYDCPIMKNGSLIPHEEVVKQFNEDAVSHSNACGMNGGNFVAGDFSQLLKMEMKFEKTKYLEMIEWLKDFLYNSVFTTERLKISASKLLIDSARVKRNPTTMGSSALKYLNFDRDLSNHNVTNVYRQTVFLEEVVKRLDSEPEAVIKEMNAFREHIVNPRRLRIHLFGDILSLQKPLEPWKSDFVPNDFHGQCNPENFVLSRELLSENAKNDENKLGFAFGLRSTDSAYLDQTCVGIQEFNDPNRAPLLVVIELLTCLEGPLWTNIRGKGLAYGYNIRSIITHGLLYFTLYRSGNLSSAYEETCKIIKEYEEKKRAITEEDLEAAKAGVIYQLLRRQSTTEAAALSSFSYTLQNVPQDMSATLLQQCESVNEEQAYQIFKKYIIPLFNSEKSNTVIVTNPKKLDALIKDFEPFRKIEAKTFEEFIV